VAGLADAGGKAAERFRVVAERWKVDDKEEKKIEGIIKEVINAPLRGETSQSRGRIRRFGSWRSRRICLRPS
jgi:Txe/YoeB family toxin of Txe-Axe toxin-antitoxin module